jgi:3-oxoadipate enol-lactonase
MSSLCIIRVQRCRPLLSAKQSPMPVLRANDAELHYEVAGSGEPLVLLHGLGSSALDWELTIAHFASKYRTIAVDFRGSGDSRDLKRPSGPFTIPQYSADTIAVLETLGTGPAHVVGLSLGGVVAFALALDAPHLVKTLTIVNSSPGMKVSGAKAQATILLRKLITWTRGPAGMAQMLAPRLFPGDALAERRALFIERMGRNKRGAYIGSSMAALSWSALERIGEIAAPTLVMSAEHDYEFLDNKQAWARLMQNAEYLEVPGTHHAMPYEAPEVFHAHLEQWLERYRGA